VEGSERQDVTVAEIVTNTKCDVTNIIFAFHKSGDRLVTNHVVEL